MLVLQLPQVSKVTFLHPNSFNFATAGGPGVGIRRLTVVAVVEPQDVASLELVERYWHPRSRNVLLRLDHAVEYDAHLPIREDHRVGVVVPHDHLRQELLQLLRGESAEEAS